MQFLYLLSLEKLSCLQTYLTRQAKAGIKIYWCFTVMSGKVHLSTMQLPYKQTLSSSTQTSKVSSGALGLIMLKLTVCYVPLIYFVWLIYRPLI